MQIIHTILSHATIKPEGKYENKRALPGQRYCSSSYAYINLCSQLDCAWNGN